MKEALSSFDVTAIVGELQCLVGGPVEKIYHPKFDHLVLSTRTPGSGQYHPHCEVWHHNPATYESSLEAQRCQGEKAIRVPSADPGSDVSDTGLTDRAAAHLRHGPREDTRDQTEHCRKIH